MTLHFYLRYHTKVGQSVFLTGNPDFLGNGDAAISMSCHNEDYWKVFIELPEDFDKLIQYKYIVRNQDGFPIYDGEEHRFLDISKEGRQRHYTIMDTWNDAGNINNAFFSKAFQNVLLPEIQKKKTRKQKEYSHEFKVKVSLLKEHETIALLGSTIHLKNWNTDDPILLSPDNNWFTVRLQLAPNEWPAAYKYGIYNTAEKKWISFEEGENRILRQGEGTETTVILHDGYVNYQPKLWKGAGLNIPVFSLRSRKSFGVGEFADIKLLVDWSRKIGVQLIQLLPINDTTALKDWRDSYPYSAVSAFALHPLYIRLEKVAGKKYAKLLNPFLKKQKPLNKLFQVDYEKVMKLKWEALHKIYDAAKTELEDDVNYIEFLERNRHWLVSYGAFSFLRDKYKTADFLKWEKYVSYNEAEILKLATPGQPYYDQIAFYYFVQYHLHLQLKEIVKYAHKHKIVLKGDIPIGIYRYSCDAWVNPSLYNTGEQAGAPPDAFATHGQNWGFPTYNWDKMKEDNFAWWRKRFNQLGNYFDAFRIDHILGFFRIWSIPYHAVQGTLGRFVPALPVHLSEFESQGIYFNQKRYCAPYITDEILKDLFRDQADVVRKEFLEEKDEGQYRLKEEVRTQRKVVDFLKEKGKEQFENGLLDLISNVILLQDDHDEDAFHFRIAVHQTSSFRGLDEHTRQQLEALYVNYFYRRQDYFWKKKAMEKLPQLKSSTQMLVCGEDLGMVPPCVPEVMKDLGILSLEIERMPKTDQVEFFDPAHARYLSVVTPSTHDMSTIRGWWLEDPEKSQRYYNDMMKHFGKAPEKCEPWINKEIVMRHLYSPAMWSIFLIQDILGISEELRYPDPKAERINKPADAHHYWRYRMHIELESLIQQTGFNEELQNFIIESGRLPEREPS